MISIITCSRTTELSDELKQNIAETIGCDYELVTIDNSSNKYNIFQAYNEGVRRSSGDILCFMHDDILFRSNEWGKVIYSTYCKDNKIGIIGFAGSHFLPKFPTYWYSSPFISEHNLTNDNGEIKECFETTYYKNNISEVAVVDGFCYFIKKETFEFIKYDEITYKGFHMYDMDICMQVQQKGYKVIVSKDILIEHAWSESLVNKKKGMDLFSKNLKIFVKKWEDMLPISRGLEGHVEQYSIDRINRLYKELEVRNSKAYKIGKFILHPINSIKNIINQ